MIFRNKYEVEREKLLNSAIDRWRERKSRREVRRERENAVKFGVERVKDLRARSLGVRAFGLVSAETGK